MRFNLLPIIVLLVLGTACTEKKEMKKTYNLFVGTYTNGDSEGIYRFTFDAANGQFSEQTLVAALPNPSYLKISSDKKNLYAIQETADFDSLGGGISAFRLQNGMLEQLNSMGTGGAHPCHVSLSNDGYAVASNYSGGNISIHKLKDDGSLSSQVQFIDHKVLDTVKKSHAHMGEFVGQKLYVSDLGLDALKVYDREGDDYVPAKQASLNLPDGAGPRHFAFGNTGILYVINELNSTITVFQKDSNSEYQEIQLLSTLDNNFEGESFCADIHLSSDGKFLYGSNRGENTIVVMSVDAETGKLETVGRTSVEGDWPRNFSIDPSGDFLLVANQRSNNITVFNRDKVNGTLVFSHELKFPSPVCLEFLED